MGLQEVEYLGSKEGVESITCEAMRHSFVSVRKMPSVTKAWRAPITIRESRFTHVESAFHPRLEKSRVVDSFQTRLPSDSRCEDSANQDMSATTSRSQDHALASRIQRKGRGGRSRLWTVVRGRKIGIVGPAIRKRLCGA